MDLDWCRCGCRTYDGQLYCSPDCFVREVQGIHSKDSYANAAHPTSSVGRSDFHFSLGSAANSSSSFSSSSSSSSKTAATLPRIRKSLTQTTAATPMFKLGHVWHSDAVGDRSLLPTITWLAGARDFSHGRPPSNVHGCTSHAAFPTVHPGPRSDSAALVHPSDSAKGNAAAGLSTSCSSSDSTSSTAMMTSESDHPSHSLTHSSSQSHHDLKMDHRIRKLPAAFLLSTNYPRPAQQVHLPAELYATALVHR